MENFLLSYADLIKTFGYWIAFFGIMFEGDIFIFILFFLASLGYFKIVKLFLIFFIGTLIGDILWYYLGAWLNNHSSFIGRLFQRVKIFDSHLIKRPFHTIFFSKFIYGIHHSLIMRAGALRFNLKKFIQYDFFSSIFWILLIGVLGYLSGASFFIFKKYLKFTEIVLFLILIGFIVIEYFIRQKSKKEL